MSAINSSNKIAATLYSLGTWFVSGIYVKIPCIKEIVSLRIITIIIIIIIIAQMTSGCSWHPITLRLYTSDRQAVATGI
jgi:hypothetical protein